MLVSTFICTPSHNTYISSFFPFSGLRAGSNRMANPSTYGLNIPIHNLRLSHFYLQFSSLPWFSFWTIPQVCSILNHHHKQKSHHGAFPLSSSSQSPSGDLPQLGITFTFITYYSIIRLCCPVGSQAPPLKSTFSKLAQGLPRHYQVSPHSHHIVSCVFVKLNYSVSLNCSSMILTHIPTTWNASRHQLAC